MKILHILPELDGGGIERILYDYCSRMILDVQFDFVVTSKREGILEEPLKKLGCRIYHVARMRENFELYLKQLDTIFRNGKYDIVHSHIGYKSFLALYYAKKYGVTVKIAHSHTCNVPETKKEKCDRLIFASLTKYMATDLFACSHSAAKWMWHNDCYIMNNAINTTQFAFSKEKRTTIRKAFGIEDKFVIGNVARFSWEKNHEFLINIFAEIKKLRDNAVLMLVGRGDLEEIITKQVKELGLEKDVLFLGVRNDVPDLLNAIDVFLLPSKHEGVPVTLVEAQANGLPMFVSDTVTKEIKLADNVAYLSLSDTATTWAKTIVEANNQRNENGIETVVSNGYDIEAEAEKMKQKYYELLKRVQ